MVATRLRYSTQYTKNPAKEQVLNERRSKKNKATNTTASVTTNDKNPEHNQLITTIINGVQNVSQHRQTQSTHIIRYPSNVSKP